MTEAGGRRELAVWSAHDLITDGPFAETREQLGGYTSIDADDLDDAIAIATGFLVSGRVEVSLELRPIVDPNDAPGPAGVQG